MQSNFGGLPFLACASYRSAFTAHERVDRRRHAPRCARCPMQFCFVPRKLANQLLPGFFQGSEMRPPTVFGFIGGPDISPGHSTQDSCWKRKHVKEADKLGSDMILDAIVKQTKKIFEAPQGTSIHTVYSVLSPC